MNNQVKTTKARVKLQLLTKPNRYLEIGFELPYLQFSFNPFCFNPFWISM